MRTLSIFIFFLFFVPSAISQIVYEPLDKSVYPYLERLSHKGIIELDDLIKPLSKKYISEKLVEAKSKIEMLTQLEKEELEFFEKDYFLEIEGFAEKNKDKSYLSYFERDEGDRYRMFSYSDKLFKFNVSPKLGLKITYPDNYRNTQVWMGFSTYGYLLNNMAISLDFKTINEKGNNLDIKKDFTPETGILPEVSDSGRDLGYSEVRASISADWGWGDLVIAKDYIEYGTQNLETSYSQIKLLLFLIYVLT